MIIKTITCHHAYNYGASLQAYALMHTLSKLGHNVEIIDYVPSYVRDYNSLWMIGERYQKNLFITIAFYAYVIPIRLLQHKKRRLFDKYNKDYLKLTSRYNSFEDLQKDPPQADVVFCGSDQIWNTTVDNGLDPSYYAAFAKKETIRASYAASFSVSKLPEEHESFVSEMLKGMNRISVREKTGLTILEKLGFNNCKVVSDPVFLPEVDDWNQLTKPVKYKDYVLVYDQENSKEIKKVAKALASKYGLQIVALRDLYPRLYANKTIWNAGPVEFLSLIKNASFVVTNSFHCTAFSLIFERDFVVMPRSHQKVNSRMIDLTDAFGVPDRYIESVEGLEKIRPIQYEVVREEISKLKKVSFDYIKDVLCCKQTQEK